MNQTPTADAQALAERLAREINRIHASGEWSSTKNPDQVIAALLAPHLSSRSGEPVNQTLLAAVKRAEWDFTQLIARGDLQDEPRAHATLKALREALATPREKEGA